MKFFLVIYLLFVLVIAMFIGYGERNENEESAKDTSKLKEAQRKFLKINIKDKNLDLNQSIKEIKEVRKKYPLDDKLKMVDIELEHKRANQSY